MKIPLMNTKAENKGTVQLPKQFDEPIRTDLIHRAFESLQSRIRQAYGSDPEAGKRQTAWMSHRRRKYKSAYGHGISRIPRKIMSRNGERMNWVGAFAPGTVGGMRAHPPKSIKIFKKDINTKERKKALCSALAATIDKITVEKRGHVAPAGYPFVIDSSFEENSKTAEIEQILLALGFEKELARASVKTVRAGKGKTRGRTYARKVGPLIVVSKTCPLLKAGINIPGVDVVTLDRLNAMLLAPGGHAGRLTIFTHSAIEKLTKEGLFL